MPAQRTEDDADGRLGWPQHGGVPSWGAVLIAVAATLAGFAVEAGLGHSELGSTFAVFYALGCLAAVLAVRQSGVFTAVIQPPLVLFVAVPTAYFLLHGSSFAGLKDVLITCGYPLIERFPLMLLTTGGVLLIGMIRWYLTQSGHSIATGGEARRADPGLLATAVAKVGSLLSRPGSTANRPRHSADRSSADRSARRQSARRQGADRSARRRPSADRSARRQSAARAAATPSYDGRPADGRERRRTNAAGDRYGRYDYPDDRYPEDRYGGAPPRRRSAQRPPTDGDPRDRPRRSQGGRDRTPPPQRRESRDRRFEQYPPPGRDRRSGPSYEPHADPYPPRRRPSNNGSTTSHHPVSRVRYRGSADDVADGGRTRR